MRNNYSLLIQPLLAFQICSMDPRRFLISCVCYQEHFEWPEIKVRVTVFFVNDLPNDFIAELIKSRFFKLFMSGSGLDDSTEFPLTKYKWSDLEYWWGHPERLLMFQYKHRLKIDLWSFSFTYCWKFFRLTHCITYQTNRHIKTRVLPSTISRHEIDAFPGIQQHQLSWLLTPWPDIWTVKPGQSAMQNLRLIEVFTWKKIKR